MTCGGSANKKSETRFFAGILGSSFCKANTADSPRDSANMDLFLTGKVGSNIFVHVPARSGSATFIGIASCLAFANIRSRAYLFGEDASARPGDKPYGCQRAGRDAEVPRPALGLLSQLGSGGGPYANTADGTVCGRARQAPRGGDRPGGSLKPGNVPSWSQSALFILGAAFDLRFCTDKGSGVPGMGSRGVPLKCPSAPKQRLRGTGRLRRPATGLVLRTWAGFGRLTPSARDEHVLSASDTPEPASVLPSSEANVDFAAYSHSSASFSKFSDT